MFETNKRKQGGLAILVSVEVLQNKLLKLHCEKQTNAYPSRALLGRVALVNRFEVIVELLYAAQAVIKRFAGFVGTGELLEPFVFDRAVRRIGYLPKSFASLVLVKE